MKEYTKYVIISKIKEVLKALFICIGFGLITLPNLIMLLITLFITIKRWLD